MEKIEFEQMIVDVNTEIKYRNKIYSIMGIDWDEKLIAIFLIGDKKGLHWIRYENCELINE